MIGLLLALLLSQVGYLNAQEQELLGFIFGNKYLTLSEDAKIYYVGGLIDMWYFMHYENIPAFYQDILAKMEGMTGLQIREIFEKFLEDHPESLHFTAA